MKIQTYEDLTIEVLSASLEPRKLLSSALQTCMKKDIDESGLVSKKLLRYLMTANHMSPLEQATMTIIVKGMSRSLLAQVTRQRTFSFASSSQHYQNYSYYPVVIHKDHKDNRTLVHSLSEAIRNYSMLVNQGLPVHEARQVLPNASAVNLQITADARNMVYFFNQRLCKRNVAEMINFAQTWHSVAKSWFPELFNLVGPQCGLTGKCLQGAMQAKECRNPYA